MSKYTKDEVINRAQQIIEQLEEQLFDEEINHDQDHSGVISILDVKAIGLLKEMLFETKVYRDVLTIKASNS